jgi:hypothetical protein
MWSYALWVKNDHYRNEESEKRLRNEEIEIPNNINEIL